MTSRAGTNEMTGIPGARACEPRTKWNVCAKNLVSGFILFSYLNYFVLVPDRKHVHVKFLYKTNLLTVVIYNSNRTFIKFHNEINKKRIKSELNRNRRLLRHRSLHVMVFTVLVIYTYDASLDPL